MIYLIAPNATHPSGGVGVAAQWVRLLIENGHEAMFITPNGDPSPFWLNFTVPAGSYADVVDAPENKVIHIWMDCMVQFRTHRAQLYYFAQDAAQPQYVETEVGRFDREYLPVLRSATLITLTHHQHWYYLYRWGLPSKVVNNFVDKDLFKPLEKAPNTVCMIDHRDHFSPQIAENLKSSGVDVRVARGSQAEVAKIMGECRYFVSDVRGRWDGFENSEGMPMPIMEAMTAGCIVLCRDTNGVREFIQEGASGYFFANEMEMPNHIRALEASPEVRFLVSTSSRYAALVGFSPKAIWLQIQLALGLM